MRNTLSLLLAACSVATCLTASAQIKAYDTESPSYVQFSNPRYEVSETETNAVVTIVRTGDYRKLAVVEYATLEGTAEENVDFRPSGGKIVFAAGQSFRTISIPVLRGSGVVAKTFQVELTEIDPTTIVTTPLAEVEIKPQPPALTIAAKAGALQVSWPDSGLPFALETHANGEWSAVANSATLADGEWTAVVDAAAPVAWFRLRLQSE